MEENNGKEGCMVRWKQILVQKVALLDGRNHRRESCMIRKTIRNSEGCMVGWNLIKGPVGKKAAMSDGREQMDQGSM
jgi:hypothetical protein